MTITQLSVFIENTPGALARITGVLAENKIDIRAMSLAETDNFGVLRLIVDDNERAGHVLRENNIVFHFTEVVAAAIEDVPGGLAKILSVLAEKGIDIVYMYAFITVSGHKAAVVLRIHSADIESATETLCGAGIKLLDAAEAANI